MLSPHAVKLPPETCDVCNSANVRLLKSRVTYSEQHADWPYRYHCRDCGASVGCHAHTLSPLGVMASRRTRKLRVKAHKAFDPIWQTELLTRTEAYEWLAAQHGVEFDDCHIGMMTDRQLEQTIMLAQSYRSILERRLAKEKRKHEKRSIRQRNRNNRGGKRRRR